LFHIAQFLGVPVQFFFEDIAGNMMTGAPNATAAGGFGERDGAPYVMDFVSSAEGLELNRSYTRIVDLRVRKKTLELVRCLAEETGRPDGVPIEGAGEEESGDDTNADDDDDEGLEAEAAAKHA
jgi:hypothetical protein